MRYGSSNSRVFRAVAVVLIPAHVLLTIPVSAIAGQEGPRKDSPLPAPKVAQKADKADSAQQEKP